MARYRRYRKYSRRSSGRWAPNIVKVSGNYELSQGEWFILEELATNPSQINSGVSNVFTVKNFEITFTIESGLPQFQENITAYIVFVPQGMNVTAGYYAQHPEYILTYKYLGSPTSTQAQTSSEQQHFQPNRMKTRLSRKLQSGDSIALFIQGSSETASSPQITVNGIVRWWSKAN